MTHLQSTEEDELNRLLGIVVDVENLFVCVHKVRIIHANDVSIETDIISCSLC